MSIVSLKIPPELSDITNTEGSWLIFKKDLGQRNTIRDLLVNFVTNHSYLENAIFASNKADLNDRIHIVLNDSILPRMSVMGTKLNDGDCVIIIPVYDGG